MCAQVEVQSLGCYACLKSSENAQTCCFSGYLGSAESTDGDLNDEEEALAKESSSLGPVELHSTPAKYILCADSLGQEAAFTQSAFQCVQTFAKEIGKAFVRTQREAVERQVRYYKHS